MSNLSKKVSLVLLLSAAAVPSNVQAGLPWEIFGSTIATAYSGAAGAGLGLITKAMLEIRKNSRSFDVTNGFLIGAREIMNEHTGDAYFQNLLASVTNYTQAGAVGLTGILAGKREFDSGRGTRKALKAGGIAGGGVLVGIKLGAAGGLPGIALGGLLGGTGLPFIINQAMLRYGTKNKKEDK